MISSLGYLRIESPDVGAWREFGVRVLGMAEGRGPNADAVYLRMDDFPARLVILPGERDRLLASGWEVAGEDALAVVGRALEDAGVAVKPGTPAELAERRVGMTEVATLDDVGRAMDRCARHGAPVSASLGRHANDEMVSFYVRTPGGFDIEYGTGGRLVDDATWVCRETTAVSLWGHSFGAGH